MNKDQKIVGSFLALFLILIFSELFPHFSFDALDLRAKGRVIAQFFTVISFFIVFIYLTFKKKDISK